MRQINCFESPTTTLLIDNDRNFYGALLPALSVRNNVYQVFSDPQVAVNSFRTSANALLYPWLRASESNGIEQFGLDADITKVPRYIYDGNRFKNTAVAVIDFDMPNMNGLECCVQLKNKNLYKILLTGIADESLAVEAFNRRLIHKYIPKHDRNLMKILNEAIEDGQQRFFERISAPIHLAAAIQPQETALLDDAFIDFFWSLRAQLNAVEHYLFERTGSTMFVDAAGNSSRLFVALERTLESVYEYAVESGVSSHIQEELRNRTKMLCYHEQNQIRLPDENSWQKYLQPVFKIEGDQTYYYSISSGCREDIVSFDDYCEMQNPHISSSYTPECRTMSPLSVPCYAI